MQYRGVALAELLNLAAHPWLQNFFTEKWQLNSFGFCQNSDEQFLHTLESEAIIEVYSICAPPATLQV